MTALLVETQLDAAVATRRLDRPAEPAAAEPDEEGAGVTASGADPAGRVQHGAGAQSRGRQADQDEREDEDKDVDKGNEQKAAADQEADRQEATGLEETLADRELPKPDPGVGARLPADGPDVGRNLFEAIRCNRCHALRPIESD